MKTESGAEEDGTNGLSGDVGVGETVDVVSLGWEVWGGSLEVDGAGSDVGGASDFGGGCELVASGAEVGGVVGSELGCDEDDDGKLDWEVGGSVGGTEVVGGELDVVGGGSELMDMRCWTKRTRGQLTKMYSDPTLVDLRCDSTPLAGSVGPAEVDIVEPYGSRSQSTNPAKLSVMANLSHRERQKGITAGHGGRSIVDLSAHLDRRGWLLDCRFTCC